MEPSDELRVVDLQSNLGNFLRIPDQDHDVMMKTGDV